MNDYQIPRNSLAWLLAAQVAVIAPHITRLPIWVTAVCAACIFWRIMVYQGRWRYPGRWTKVGFVVGGIVGIPFGFHSFFGVEPWVALLIVAYVLKLLEMHHKRDAYIVVLLGYFVAMTEFLFSQTIPWTLYVIGAVTAVTAGLVGLNQTRSHRRPLVTLKTAGVLLGQAIPLMAVLFVLFPRMQPLWTVPLPSQTAKTGVTDSMTPGDIAQLSRSADLAFKVTFDGAVPPNNELYWRGLVLSHFDGRTWTQEPGFQQFPWMNRNRPPAWTHHIERLGNAVSYTVIMEPTQQHWLFTLTVPNLPHDNSIVMLRDFRLGSTEPVENKLRYRVTSDLDYRIDPEISDYTRYRNTALPGGIDPKARKLAADLLAKSSGARDYIRRVMRMYAQDDFAYTLNPPTLSGQDSVDQFLFDSRRGFCEHFAGSFAFLMRAAHIPARVVIGYQGGEYNQFANYVSVYQYNAHAWVEVWLQGEGWVREDPTAVVAPERIADGLEAAVRNEASFLSDSPLSLWSRQSLLLADLRLQLSAISYYWDSWVVGYTPDVQMDLIRSHLGHISRTQIGMIMLGLFFGLLGMVGCVILLKRPDRPLDPVDREYMRFCAALGRHGLARRVGEGPLDYAQRVSAERPDLAAMVGDVTSTYIELNYGAGNAELPQLRRTVRALRLKALA